MTGSLIRLELRRSRSLVVWLVVTLVAYGGFMAAFYPTMVENAKAYQDMLAFYPKELMAAFGMDPEMGLADPGNFFNTYIGSMIWPIVAAIGAILLATRSTAADVDRGWAELLLATPVSRTRYLLAAILSQVVAMAILAAAAVLGILVVGPLVGAEFDAARFSLAVVMAFAFGCAMAAVTTLIGAVTLSRGIAGGLAAAILLAMYLARTIATLEPRLDWLASLSAFTYNDSTGIIDTGVLPWADLAVFAAVSIVAWGLAILVFRRRDILT
jgi:ABC-2 type transport system permease protein